MTVLDRETLEKFVKLAGDRLEGDWVVIGGVVLPLLGAGQRVTVDIDIVGPEGSGNRETLALMRIAERLGLPVEAVNQAGSHFLHRIAGWRKQIVPLHEGRSATIHRPSVTLFILLKMSRLSESDLADCLAFLDLARSLGERPDVKRILASIAKQRRGKELSSGKRDRMAILAGRLREAT